jgi:hypothetical protein
MNMIAKLLGLKLERGKRDKNLGAPKMNSHRISRLFTSALGVNRSRKNIITVTTVAAKGILETGSISINLGLLL